MELDLKTELTMQGVAALIASSDDTEGRRLQVTRDGIAYICDDLGPDGWDMLFRIETFDAGNDELGEAASQSEEWVEAVFETLKQNYPKPRSRVVEIRAKKFRPAQVQS